MLSFISELLLTIPCFVWFKKRSTSLYDTLLYLVFKIMGFLVFYFSTTIFYIIFIWISLIGLYGTRYILLHNICLCFAGLVTLSSVILSVGLSFPKCKLYLQNLVEPSFYGRYLVIPLYYPPLLFLFTIFFIMGLEIYTYNVRLEFYQLNLRTLYSTYDMVVANNDETNFLSCQLIEITESIKLFTERKPQNGI